MTSCSKQVQHLCDCTRCNDQLPDLSALMNNFEFSMYSIYCNHSFTVGDCLASNALYFAKNSSNFKTSADSAISKHAHKTAESLKSVSTHSFTQLSQRNSCTF